MADTRVRPFDISLRMVFAIAVPMSLAQLSTPLVGLVDMAVIGQEGSAAVIGAVALGAVLFSFIGGALNFLRMGTTALVAQAVGADDPATQRLTLWRALALSVVIGVVVLALTPFLLPLFIGAMGASDAVAGPLAEYVNTRAWGVPLILANYAVLGWMLGLGRAGLALIVQTLMALVNIILSVALVFGLGWGVFGVALASNAAELAALVAGLGVMAAQGMLRPPPWREVLERAAALRMMAVNGDLMVRSMLLIAAFAFFNAASARGGDVVLAANAILLNIFSVCTYLLDGLATSAESLGGRAVGARYKPAFDKTVRLTVIAGGVLSASLTLIWLVGGGPFVNAMTTAQEVRDAAIAFVPWAALTGFTGSLAFVMDGIFIGATWTRTMRNMMVLCSIVFIAVWWATRDQMGNHGLWLALNIWLLARGVSLWVLVPRLATATFAGRDVR